MTSNNEHPGCPNQDLYVQFSTRGTKVLGELTDSWAGAEKYKMNQEYLLITNRKKKHQSLRGVCQKFSRANLNRFQLAKDEKI